MFTLSIPSIVKPNIADKARYHFTLVKLRNSAEMDQEVYQRVLALSTEKEEKRKA